MAASDIGPSNLRLRAEKRNVHMKSTRSAIWMRESPAAGVELL